MRKKIIMKKFLLSFVVLFGLASTANATSALHGTKEQAIAMVERAIAMVESDGLASATSAIHDAENTAFHDRDLYVFIFKNSGETIAHGAKSVLVGKNLIGLTDQSGKKILVEMIDVTTKTGSGWVDYTWPNPTTNKIENKSSYVVKLEDNKFIGVGVYAD